MARKPARYARKRTTFLPEEMSVALRLLLLKAAGLALAGVGGLLGVALYSHHPGDPSFNASAAGGQPIHNLAGRSGAYLSDALLQWFGMAGWVPVLVLVCWGMRQALTARPIRQPKIRSALMLCAMLFGAIALAPLPVPPGLKGLVSDGGAAGLLLFGGLADAGRMMIPRLQDSWIAAPIGLMAGYLLITAAGITRGALTRLLRISGAPTRLPRPDLSGLSAVSGSFRSAQSGGWRDRLRHLVIPEIIQRRDWASAGLQRRDDPAGQKRGSFGGLFGGAATSAAETVRPALTVAMVAPGGVDAMAPAALRRRAAGSAGRVEPVFGADRPADASRPSGAWSDDDSDSGDGDAPLSARPDNYDPLYRRAGLSAPPEDESAVAETIARMPAGRPLPEDDQRAEEETETDAAAVAGQGAPLADDPDTERDIRESAPWDDDLPGDDDRDDMADEAGIATPEAHRPPAAAETLDLPPGYPLQRRPQAAPLPPKPPQPPARSMAPMATAGSGAADDVAELSAALTPTELPLPQLPQRPVAATGLLPQVARLLRPGGRDSDEDAAKAPPCKPDPIPPPPVVSARPVREQRYQTPPLTLLVPHSGNSAAMTAEQTAAAAEQLRVVLSDFGVNGQIVKVRPGPVVTLFELEPAPGTKTARVIGLADDIARSMSALSVRIATVPGRSVIGVELPNKVREMVSLREMLSQESFIHAPAPLTLMLGKDIGGQPVMVDLARMPHLLIAGTTGSGKSVAINTMILSLLYRLRPDECRLIMIDPKMLELSVYDRIPHLLAPVVTEPGKAVVALKWAVREMEERYRAMTQLNVRNIASYNQRLAEARGKGETLMRTVQTGFDPDTGKPVYEDQELNLDPLPHIVIIVDEMADLMLVAGKDIEAAVQRLAQMARASGIHLIMATQRPSVDVITGTIKANFPSRVSFQVSSKIDSRTILGEQGAEQLLGQGDMLYMAAGGRVTRVHGPFVSDREVEVVVEHLRRQGEPAYVEEVTTDDEPPEEGYGAGGNREDSGDDLYDRAVDLVLRERKASTSFVQRHLQIGYNRAARLIERMEQEGVISRANHVGKREVLGRAPDE